MKTIKNQLAVIVGITSVLGFASVGARAEDGLTNVVSEGTGIVLPKKDHSHPERPPRPDKKGKGDGEAPSITDIKDVIKTFQDEKKKFIEQQKELKKESKEGRGKVRDDLNKDKVIEAARQQVNDSINDAKRQALEQARKLADEAKQAAKDGRKRD